MQKNFLNLKENFNKDDIKKNRLVSGCNMIINVFHQFIYTRKMILIWLNFLEDLGNIQPLIENVSSSLIAKNLQNVFISLKLFN